MATSTPDRPQYFNLAEAAANLYPAPIHPATITRHILRGHKFKDGSFQKLVAMRTPSGWFVTREAVDGFIAAITADRTGGK